MVKKIWLSGEIIFVALVVLYFQPFVPLFETNSTTLMLPSREAQVAAAKALSVALGEPVAELNTGDVRRFLFRDGTSVDSLVHSPSFQLMFEPLMLKQIVLSIWSRYSPLTYANRIALKYRSEGHEVQIIPQPDTAFKKGDAVLLLAIRSEVKASIIIRKNALRMGGPRPRRFTGWE